MFTLLKQVGGRFFRKNISSETKFWNWFVQNKGSFESFMESERSDYTEYKKLSRKIRKYSPHIFPELTRNDEGFVLVITADGKADGVEAVNKLYDSQPTIEHWTIQKFRQPKDGIQLNFKGVEYPESDIKICPDFVEDIQQFDIAVYIRNMDQDKNGYQALASLYLDHYVGEWNVISKIRYIDFFNLSDDEGIENSLSLFDLKEIIESTIQ